MMMTATSCDEFTCTDCGRHVYALPARDPLPTRCLECDWLAECVPDPAEREAIRKRLIGDRQAMP